MGITVKTTPKNRISINSGGNKRIIVNTGGGVSATPAEAIDTIRELKDVDASDVDNNETLVYDESSGKFVVKQLPLLDGGTF